MQSPLKNRAWARPQSLRGQKKRATIAISFWVKIPRLPCICLRVGARQRAPQRGTPSQPTLIKTKSLPRANHSICLAPAAPWTARQTRIFITEYLICFLMLRRGRWMRCILKRIKPIQYPSMLVASKAMLKIRFVSNASSAEVSYGTQQNHHRTLD